MAKPSIGLTQQIRNAAQNLNKSNQYQWGHMGACNCGFLAQEITQLTKADIHSRAMQKYGDWNEQVDDYCPTSGLPMDELISELLNAGLDRDDLKNLEKLSDKAVLNMLPKKNLSLNRNRKNDVVLYMVTWADLLEKELLSKINLETLSIKKAAPKQLEEFV